MRSLILTLLAGAATFAADNASIEKGRAEEKRVCFTCHGPRIVHSQRLSRAVWDRELTKMTGWGTEIKEREALLDYLVANYGDDKPAPEPILSGNGSKRK